ncbi:hypothetical protein QE417_000275 [Mucilaginibacter terrae]|uniref:Uncharacterized protein n=1 Tax=Mucilaginibacter terrae TaxID=1955052 RepID=A0ABU3GN45_9SPHI|nr:hypothetical protein [Mucilaginibacter terrae]
MFIIDAAGMLTEGPCDLIRVTTLCVTYFITVAGQSYNFLTVAKRAPVF